MRDKGQALGHLAAQIGEFTKSEPGDGQLAAERELLAQALDDVQAMIGAMVGALMTADPRAEGGDPRNVYKVGQNTTRLLLAGGDLVVGWLLLRQAELASARLADGSGLSPQDRAFYQGKMASAKFFCRNILTNVFGRYVALQQEDLSAMEIPEEAF